MTPHPASLPGAAQGPTGVLMEGELNLETLEFHSGAHLWLLGTPRVLPTPKPSYPTTSLLASGSPSYGRWTTLTPHCGNLSAQWGQVEADKAAGGLPPGFST